MTNFEKNDADLEEAFAEVREDIRNHVGAFEKGPDGKLYPSNGSWGMAIRALRRIYEDGYPVSPDKIEKEIAAAFLPPPPGTCDECLNSWHTFNYGPPTCDKCGKVYQNTQGYTTFQCPECSKKTRTCPMCAENPIND